MVVTETIVFFFYKLSSIEHQCFISILLFCSYANFPSKFGKGCLEHSFITKIKSK